jgi:hypothetical protein
MLDNLESGPVESVLIGEVPLTIENVLAVAQRGAPLWPV